MRRLLLLLAFLGAAFVLWPRKIERVSKPAPTPVPRLLKESSLHVPSIEPTRGVGSTKPDKPERSGH